MMLILIFHAKEAEGHHNAILKSDEKQHGRAEIGDSKNPIGCNTPGIRGHRQYQNGGIEHHLQTQHQEPASGMHIHKGAHRGDTYLIDQQAPQRQVWNDAKVVDRHRHPPPCPDHPYNQRRYKGGELARQPPNSIADPDDFADKGADEHGLNHRGPSCDEIGRAHV